MHAVGRGYGLLKVQAAFDKDRSSENYFSDGFEITGNMGISLDHGPSCVCCRLDYDMVWNHSVTTKTACVPHTPYTLILRFASPAGRGCGVATHAVSGNVGYSLLITNGSVKYFPELFDHLKELYLPINLCPIHLESIIL